ncbi:MAG: glutathione peroxidase [Elusimicrobia bacterium]|nr:glutathione peroxidase [Elusimicrobiota bacterium]
MDTKTAPAGALYAFEARLNDGTLKRLEDYRGQVLLIVNTASECGFTPQYEGLEYLHRTYHGRGLRVLAFPSNDFGAQEPGTDAQIRAFCFSKFAVGFELFGKIAVKGPEAHPLYKFLATESGHNGPIPWNFSKFLVARDGRVVERFGPDTDPASERLVGRVEKLIAEPVPGGKPGRGKGR